MGVTRRKDIDGLRTLAVFGVIFYHLYPNLFPGGFLGVDIFFVISGFLITSKLIKAIKSHKFSYWRFFFNRIKRLMPPLLLVIVVTLVVGYLVLLPNEFEQLIIDAIFGFSYTTNISLWNSVGYFDRSAEIKPFLHLWSLGIEEQFYLIWPVCLLLFFHTRIGLFRGIWVIVIMSILAMNFSDEQARFYLLHNRMWELALGGALVPLQQIYPQLLNYGLRRVLCLLSQVLIVFAFLFGNNMGFPNWFVIAPLLGTSLLILDMPDVSTKKMINSWLFVSCGVISYSLYLWHWPFISILHITELQITHGQKACVFFISIVLAILTYFLIEKPLLKIRMENLNKAEIFRSATRLGGVAVIFIFSLFFLKNHINVLPKMALLEGITQSSKIGYTDPYVQPSNPEVIIMGDSHAMHLYAGATHFKDVFPAEILGDGGTPPFLGVYLSDEHKEKVVSYIDKILKSDVDHVLLSFRITGFVTGFRNSGEGDKPLKYTFMNDKKEVFENNFFAVQTGLANIISAIVKANKTPYLLVQPPPTRQKGHLCVRPFQFGESRCSNNDRQYIDQRFAGSWDIIRGLSNQFPKFKVIDLTEDFCNEKECRFRDEHGVFYTDTNHLSVHGSKYVYEKIIQRLSL